MLERLKFLFSTLNSKGLPIPLLRDPKSGVGSISFTMLFLSFNMVLFGLIGKYSKVLDIDLNQSLTLFGITSGLYFGRTLSGTKTNSDNKKDNE